MSFTELYFICVLMLNTMHLLFERASGLTETVIAAAVEVHRVLLLCFLCFLLFKSDNTSCSWTC